jgi:hypothetical protein
LNSTLLEQAQPFLGNGTTVNQTDRWHPAPRPLAAQVSRWTKQEQIGYLHKTLKLEDGDGASIEVEFEFLPYW